ncbi:hypothetical protein PAMC26577_21835 [Caballeronia sordidicola]|uniref:Uncharacterized protein n=2 Tax=Caballeronia sordidicola TaxID=196367 RepID=A0A242MLE2_CABSO|nr:hypothetical protein PAMC26577_21835 [Caballeronia sordidicola]
MVVIPNSFISKSIVTNHSRPKVPTAALLVSGSISQWRLRA